MKWVSALSFLTWFTVVGEKLERPPNTPQASANIPPSRCLGKGRGPAEASGVPSGHCRPIHAWPWESQGGEPSLD